jgi:hypothetical protein
MHGNLGYSDDSLIPHLIYFGAYLARGAKLRCEAQGRALRAPHHIRVDACCAFRPLSPTLVSQSAIIFLVKAAMLPSQLQ